MLYTAWFDRRGDSIDGYFTIQDEHGIPVFKRLLARSGQMQGVGSNWMRGTSPIPFSDQVEMGYYFLWLQSVGAGTHAGHSGIGEAFPISSRLSNRDLIQGPRPGMVRELIRLHAENDYPGSAGCIVLVDTDKAYNEVFPWLRELGKTESYIKLKVV